ncbi:LegC2/C7 family Dot/Icm T4SS effector [Legionella pneumophila]|uniref:LegC2/C7 family Dot/Icm T4SS effector n=1 Tax=Legionella pneumophila TaxID=446 RepID=UPI003A4C747F
MDQETLTPKIENDNERFEKMVTTQNQIQKIKAELDVIIQSMNNNPSYFSRAARFWNDIPLWQKITAGAVITVPLLMIGILVNLGALIMLSVIAVFVYTGSSILLDNHQRQNTNTIEHLKAGVSSLVDLLDTVISTLDRLREQLAIEIDAFESENARLTETIGQFGEHINTLKSEIVALTEADRVLRATQVHLEHTATMLKRSNDAQSHLVAQTQKQLEQVISNYKDNQNQLADKIQELDEVKEQLRNEVEQSRAVARVFKGTVETFSNLAIQDTEQRAAFQERLADFLTNKEKSFIEVADRICDAEYKLSAMASN